MAWQAVTSFDIIVTFVVHLTFDYGHIFHLFLFLLKVSDIVPLSSLPLLEQLMIKGNPFIDKVPFYRQKVFDQLYNTASQVQYYNIILYYCMDIIIMVV